MDKGGNKALKAPWIEQLRFQKKFPHYDTCQRWIQIYKEADHVLPKRATGNKFSQREVKGQDLFNLALFRLAFPKAYIDEVRAYLHNRNPANEPYSWSQIFVRAGQRLGLWLKVASTTADEAYRPANLLKRQMYWGENYPHGVNDQDLAHMIDIDEAQFKLQSQDRKRGKVTKQRRCNGRGKYKKGVPGVSLLIGISGDGDNPFEFHRMFSQGGTDLARFFTFMSEFIEYLDVNRPNESFCFTLDNLNIHNHPIILNLIEEAGHRVVFRAPYWSCDGAIEYVFNTIQTHLQMDDDGVDNVDDLIEEIDDIIFRMAIIGFRKYFEHIWYNE